MGNSALIWVGVVLTILLGQIYLLGLRMSRPEKMLQPIPGGLSKREQEAISPYAGWLESVGLQFRMCFKFGALHAAVFQQGEQPRFFSFLFHQKLTFSAESYLADLTILDTSNSGNIGLFPRPGAYAQSYPNIPAQEVWKRHLAGEAYLSEKFGFRWTPIDRRYDDLVIAALRIRMKHNRSQILWPARVLYRYFVTRHLIANRSIAQQFP